MNNITVNVIMHHPEDPKWSLWQIETVCRFISNTSKLIISNMGWYTFHVKLDDYSHKIIKKRKKKWLP